MPLRGMKGNTIANEKGGAEPLPYAREQATRCVYCASLSLTARAASFFRMVRRTSS